VIRGPRTLEEVRGQVPRERVTRGAYAVAELVAPHALGVWDAESGKHLFLVERAELLEILPERAAAVAVCTRDRVWTFDRFALPSGERLSSVPVPKRLTGGWPAELVVHNERATVYCGDDREAYRFHVTIDELGDRIVEPVSAKPRRAAAKTPRSATKKAVASKKVAAAKKKPARKR
jgi:hypothetical protein